MSYYYRFNINTVLKKDTPQDIVDFLYNVINNTGIIPKIDTPHPFFGTERWIRVFAHHKDYPKPIFFKYDGGYYDLQLNGEINYGSEEIKLFVEWIKPYVAGRKKKQHIGSYKGESYETPLVNLYVERQIN